MNAARLSVWLRKRGAFTKPVAKEFPGALERRQAGESFTSLAISFGVSDSCIAAYLEAEGAKMGRLCNDIPEDTEARYLAGDSAGKLAKEIGCNHRRVVKWLKARGVWK